MIDVFLEGVAQPVGRLTRQDSALSFRYLADHAISVSLPVQEGPYGDAPTRAFFGNLLQENASLEAVMARHGIGRDDIAGLLFHLGRDCAGAISCVPQGEGAGKAPGRIGADYDPLPEADLAAIMTSLRDRRRLPAQTRDPSPLAGVQGKIALTRLAQGFGTPRPGSGAPTTHILKVPARGEEHLVAQEHRLMTLAGQVVDAAQVEVLEVGGVQGLLITRFDRVQKGDLVHRLHQEDFCQALGLPLALKYEREGQGARRFCAAAVGRLLARTAVPLEARRRFLAMTVLNLALGNTDNHAKNHALLYTGGAPVLAPLYDVVPVRLETHLNHDFAFAWGRAQRIEDLYPDALTDLAVDLGFAARGARNLRGQAAEVLRKLAPLVAGIGGPQLKGMGDMAADQMRRMVDAFGLEVAVPQRDAFVARGGGFLLGS